ncbi:MAG TPA: IS1634 family transposase [Roseiarcus sp.]|nr:IS1634 family transposase [Roseiarcus sp.]
MVYSVAIVFVDSSLTRLNGRTYPRHLLRETYREDGKVKHRTLANLTHCKPEEVEAIRLALKHKGDLGRILASAVEGGPELKQGPSVGAVWVLAQLARELGVVAALGPSREGKLALWQIVARVLDQGSRLSAVRLAGGQAVGAALGMTGFDEDDLYANLDWLADNQADIESRLFAHREAASASDVFLYDVTSTYLEGEHNALAAFGYNRDRKSGKRQIVIGLLADADGRPLSIEVFPGNTSDVKTFSSQLNKAAARFGVERVTFVGDRGMIKAPQRAEIGAAGFHYITAITKAQIDALIAAGVLQMDLFEETLAEVEGSDGERYVLRRNPARAEELAASRADKLKTLRAAAEAADAYLNEHPRAAAETQLARLRAKSKALHLDKFVAVAEQERRIVVTLDEAALAEAARLDGCYALRTDLPKTVVAKEIVHDRYKDLAQVEWAFRDSKTVQLEMRPVYLRDENRTRGHALVVMLAYLMTQALRRRWRGLDLTVQEGLDRLASLCVIEVIIAGRPSYNQVPTPRDDVRQLFEAADVALPAALPLAPASVATNQKLPLRRKQK